MNVVKLLAIVVATAAVTLLCIRSGQAMAKTLTSMSAVYRTSDVTSRPEVRDRGKHPPTSGSVVDTAVADSADNLTKSSDRTEGQQTVVSDATPTTGVSEMHNRTTRVEVAAAAAGRSMDGGIGAIDNGFTADTAKSRWRTPSTLARDKSPKQRDHHGGLAGYERYVDDENDSEATADAGPHRTNNNRHYGKHIDHNDGYSTIIDTDDVSVAEEDGSTGYRSSYDLLYNVGGGYRPAKHPNDGAGWTAIASRPGHVFSEGSPTSPGGNGNTGQSHYGPAAPTPYSVGPAMMDNKQMSRPPWSHLPPPPFGVNYVPSPNANGYYQQQPPAVGYYSVHNPLQQIQSVYGKIDWHKLGILALIKFGLAKLKAFGFLKILFLLVFKLKLFLIAVFFKFLLILKLMKFLKLLLVPLVILAVMPVISSVASPVLVGGLLSIPSRIIEYLTGPVYAPAPVQVTPTAKSVTEAPAQPSTVIDAKAGNVSSRSLFGSDDPRLYGKRRAELLDSAFRKVLDSDKCIERIACRMAIAENSGLLPISIDWLLHRVSKYFPNENLKSYFRSYNNVNNEIKKKSEAPKNWVTWCLEHYSCSTTNMTNVRHIKQ